MQRKVKFFNEKVMKREDKASVETRLLDIQSELGELAKEVLKATDYGKKSFVKTDDFEMEFGDVLYSLLSLANETGIDSEKALDKILAKYKARIEKKGSMGSEN